MPAFDAEARRRGKRPADFFLDWNHLNREGSALVAEALASEIEALTQSTR